MNSRLPDVTKAEKVFYHINTTLKATASLTICLVIMLKIKAFYRISSDVIPFKIHTTDFLCADETLLKLIFPCG